MIVAGEDDEDDHRPASATAAKKSAKRGPKQAQQQQQQVIAGEGKEVEEEEEEEEEATVLAKKMERKESSSKMLTAASAAKVVAGKSSATQSVDVQALLKNAGKSQYLEEEDIIAEKKMQQIDKGKERALLAKEIASNPAKPSTDTATPAATATTAAAPAVSHGNFNTHIGGDGGKYVTGTKREFRLRSENEMLFRNTEKTIRHTFVRIDKEIGKEIDKPSQRIVTQLTTISSLREESKANTEYIVSSLERLQSINKSFGF